MPDPNTLFDMGVAANLVAPFAIGFAVMTEHERGSGKKRVRVEDAQPFGSGTLVSIGGVHGILTAGHVLAKLPDAGKVAIVRFPSEHQAFTIRMEQTHKLFVWDGEERSDGPDIGFLRMSEGDANTLKAVRPSNFLNLYKARNSLSVVHSGKAHAEAVAGMVGERTTDLESIRPKTRRKGFELLFCGGQITAEWSHEGYDLCTFAPVFGDGHLPPASYGGVSGGGLWQVIYEPDGKNNAHEIKLIGVAFFEIGTPGAFHINCHRQTSIYERLIQQAVVKWPDCKESDAKVSA